MSYLTKTKKVKKNNINKKALWAKFNDEIKDNKPNIPIECIYRTNGLREKCDCCGGIITITDEGFQACTNSNCGIIYKDLIDQTAEWRYYGVDDSQSSDPTRCGLPINPLLRESSFGCKVLCASKSSYEMRKIRRYTEWQSMPYKEKAQYDEFQKIALLGSQAGIPKLIIDDAMRYHKKISEVKTFRGCNRDGIIAASIYIAARLNSFPRTAKEIAEIFYLDTTSATRGCKNAVHIINELEGELCSEDKTILCQTTPSAFIERYCSKLHISDEITKICIFVAMHIQHHNLIPENTPHSIAAGIVYFISHICNLNISKKNVQSISDISEVTINKCYKKLDSMKTKIIPLKILKKYEH